MTDMSSSRQRVRDLLTTYNHSLEQQIVGRGFNLACRDEEIWRQVEVLLRDGDAQETHCLGLDPLRVMEESLMAASTTAMRAASGGQAKARGGLQGLAKAFEVLEQAALNLYLGPWRDEYKVIKMYSGMFTHYIKPVLSMQQIEKLFGLLGYQPSPSQHEQLLLQALRISPASLDDLLQLSCAFYLARCECRLLGTTLGKHVGDAQWELSVIRERQRGNSLQVALDNTKRTLKVNQPLMEPFGGEVDMDLYTDEHINQVQREAAVNDDGSPHSLTWLTQQSPPPPAVKRHSNGMISLSSSYTSLPITSCISTLSCQMTKMSNLNSESTRSTSANKRQGRHQCEDSKFNKAELQSQSSSLQVEVMGLCRSEAEDHHFCSCLQSPHCPRTCCNDCKTGHKNTCALLESCLMKKHSVVTSYITPKKINQSGGVSPQSESPRITDMNASTILTSSNAAMSSLVLCDDPEFMIQSLHPITYHDCCNLAQLDPQVLCQSCSVFHSCSCRDVDYCQIHHTVKQLGVCTCGKACSRKPLVLCRYCGKEYCTDCWYRSPVKCTCGQTFDQSSSV